MRWMTAALARSAPARLMVLLMLAAAACGPASQPPQSEATGTPNDRTVLPVPEPQQAPITALDVRQATPPARFQVTAPAGAPNVVIVLIDDMGFGQSSAFGGGVDMPTLDRLAAHGLRYNHFHTTALCSPTRTALLTGRNHHSNNAGAIMEVATAFPGNTGIRPQSIAPLAEILRLNGYSTSAFGKYHETPPWEVSVSGPYDRWPTRSGFDKFYGFIGGETNQWFPYIFDGTTKVEPPKDPNYHFTTDMTNQAIAWVSSQQALTPDKPFFMYFATGATHAPHHAPQDWIQKYKGKFDQGWDTYREETLARQKQLGVVPESTELAPKPEAIKDWDALTADEKRLFARQMEIFAAFGAHTDNEIGRLVQALEDMGEMDNTLLFYIVGDNGASAEGGMVGMFNEMTYFNGVPETVEGQLAVLDELGGPKSFNHYAAGWAVAGNTPFTWTKQVASNFGGTRNGLVIHWPRRVTARGEVRPQFHHVVDIAPTILEAAGVPEPRIVHGTPQRAMEGVSMLYTFADAAAKTRHPLQYFEMIGNRASYQDGWLAGTIHKAPWEAAPRRPLAEDHWELYDTTHDFSLALDLAAANPQKLQAMQELFMQEAVKYNVLPIDDRSIERFDPVRAGRPDLMGGRQSLTVFAGMTGMMENAFINVKNKSVTFTADVEVPEKAQGVILCQGGRFGGWSLYMQNGRPAYAYNWVGLERYQVAATQALPAGRVTLRYEFVYDGGKPGSGGQLSIYAGDRKLGEGRIEHTNANMFSLDDAADVGVDEGTPVSDDYRSEGSHFTGRIRKVTIDVQ